MSINPIGLAITAALNAASMAISMLKHVEGPRLSELSASVADYGTPLNYFYGQRRVEAPCFYCEPIKEEQQERKTKGGKYNEYTYYGTWASLIADHEILQVDNVWFDRHVVYDLIDGDNLIETSEGYDLASYMRIYLGEEDQEPDERMLATVEAEEGVGTCPAYLGVSYIFFEDVPLEKLGNRFPQVTVLASAHGPGPKDDILPTPGTTPDQISISPTGKFVAAADNSSGSTVLIRNRRGKQEIVQTWAGIAPNDKIAVSDKGNVYVAAYGLQGKLWKYSRDGTVAVVAQVPTSPDYLGPVYCFNVPKKGTYVFATKGGPGYFGNYIVWYNETTGASGEIDAVNDWGFMPSGMCQDNYGNIWACGPPEIQSALFDITDCYFRKVISTGRGKGPNEFSVTGLDPENSTSPVMTFYKKGKREGFVFFWNMSYIYFVDRFTGEVTHVHGYNTTELEETDQQFSNKPPSKRTLWTGSYTPSTGRRLVEYTLPDFTIKRVLYQSDYDHDVHPTVDASWGAFFDFRNNALISGGYGDPATSDGLVWRYLYNAPITLGEICADVAIRAGIEPDDIDFDELDQIVYGYSWTQGSGRDIVSHLLEVYDSDIRPHDFILHGKKRDGAVNGDDIDSEWLVRDSGTPLYTVTTIGDGDLPRRIFTVFADLDADQQPNSAIAQRNAASVSTKREITYDINTLALSVDEAQTFTERRLRREWMGSIKVKCVATPLELQLEPGDVRYLNLEGETILCSLRRMTIRANRAIETEWERDDATLASHMAVPGASPNGRPETGVFAPVETEGFILDIPLLDDSQDQGTPFVYVAAAPVSSGSWSGAEISVSSSGNSGTFSANWSGVGSTQAATWGTVTGALGDVPTDVMDEGSEIIVTLAYGTLESVTDEYLAANSDANLALIGNEIVQFRDAVLQSDGEYLVSGFVRGHRGTEQYVPGHVDGERFLLLNTYVRRQDMGAGAIGYTSYYKADTAGYVRNSTEVDPLTFAAVANKPYSPCHLELVKEDSGDWTITWVRRTRVGGATLNGQDVPLGETSEAYRVRILDGLSGATIRTISTTEETATYTVADQTSDWGSEQMILAVEVVQMSPSLGIEGFPTVGSA